MEVLLWLVISICILDFMMAMKTLFMEGLFKYNLVLIAFTRY